ncbi:MAG: hypothetical protein ACOYK1_08065 [Vampirovibrionia bacterium]|jgi:hypothetical protein
MVRFFNNLLVLVVLVFSLNSCATIFGNSRKSEITVESDRPLGIKLQSSKGMVINKTTPFTTVLERGSTYVLSVKSDQFQSDDIFIDKKIRGLAFFNLIFPLPWIMDFATGNAWTHDKHYVYINTSELQKIKSKLDTNKKDFIADIKILIEGREEGKEKANLGLHRKVKFHRV